MSDVRVRDGSDGDLALVHAINQRFVPHVGTLTIDEMSRLLALCGTFRVVAVEGRPVAFLLGLTPDAPYQSENFLWFKERYPSFLYVDRIAVAEGHHRAGYGSMLYRDAFAQAAATGRPIVTCEINVRPPNPESSLFHERLGFVEVGTQDTEGGTKTVSLRLYDVVSARATDDREGL